MGETLASNGSKANHDHFRCQMKTSFIQRISQRKRLTTHAMVAWEFIVKRDKLLLNPLAYFTPFADLTNLIEFP